MTTCQKRINIFFVTTSGKSKAMLANLNPTRNEFIEMAKEATEGASLEGSRFVVGCKQIKLDSDEQFEDYRPLFQNNCNVFVLQRLLGGGFVEVGLLWDVLLSQLDSALDTQPKRVEVCSICYEDDRECLKICCSYQCLGCIKDNFKHNNAAYKCYGTPENPTCGMQHDLGNKFGVAEFSAAIHQFRETQELMKFIDCQICSCGDLLINDTLWAKQTCKQCSRTFCFFCNRTWSDTEMTNLKYYCSDSCDYKNRISFELVELVMNTSLKVPNRRACPSCSVLGAYDEKCKYHTCTNPSCKKSFCFICLKTESECKRVYSSNYAHKCTEIVIQNFEDFPHLGV